MKAALRRMSHYFECFCDRKFENPSKWTTIAILTVTLFVMMLASGCNQQSPETQSAQKTGAKHMYTSFDLPEPKMKKLPAKTINFEQAELPPVLKLYGEISGRSIICAGDLPAVKISFFNQTPLTPVEALQALDTVLAAQGITTVYLSTQFVKVVTEKNVHQEAGPFVDLRPEQLPDSSSYLIYLVRLKKTSAQQVVSAIQPFAKLQGSIIAISHAGTLPPAFKASLPKALSTIITPKDTNLLILRDYSSSVRRMLQMLQEIDQ
jgi:type II secretory pathway component GspD/PulD (secretin)